MSVLTSLAGLAARPMLAVAAPYLIGAAVLAGGGFIAYEVHHQRDIGREEIRAEWNTAKAQQTAVDFRQSEKNAAETARRLAQQEENQRAQTKQLQAAKDAADRNARDAERVRQQAATAADQWSHTLRNSPTGAELAAADAAIHVYADLFGRADRAAGELAAYSDTARASGLKCSADYDALTKGTQ